LSGIPLITKGMICVETIEIVNRYVMPMELQIEDTQSLELQIIDKNSLTLNASDVADNTVNLKLSEDQINVKEEVDTNINIEE
jgi:hypothetical protein